MIYIVSSEPETKKIVLVCLVVWFGIVYLRKKEIFQGICRRDVSNHHQITERAALYHCLGSG